MANTNDATVNAFYLAYYGRPADPAGLAYWSQALATSNGDFSSIISAFSTSAEATAHIGTGTATDQISNVYQQLFGHAPDAAGLAYWTAAISSGNMSLADAAFQITQGAQTSDLTVSTLRLDAAAQFTATIAASGTAYDGDAGIAAGRVMIAAVNANSSAADIQSLVTAGASLAQTAHDNPAVITALANGGDLNTLLSTASGQSDPVALIQALASIGKAALTDSAGLTALLHGGGVAGLLASLPAGTTIKDVAAAVETGGLSAGTVVATTPVDTSPPPDTTAPAQGLKLSTITHTDETHATVVFTYTGTINLPSEALFYRIDSNDWTRADTTIIDTVHKTVTFTNVDVSSGEAHIFLEAKDPTGNTRDVNAIVDGPLVAPTAALAVDTGSSNSDHITNNPYVLVSGLKTAPGTGWAYSSDGGEHWTPGATPNADGTVFLRSPGVGDQTLLIHNIDATGTVGPNTTIHYTYDQGINAQLNVDGFEHYIDVTVSADHLAFHLDQNMPHASALTTVYEISTDGADFATWDGNTSLDDGTYYFRAKLSDPAGNAQTTQVVTVHIDNSVPLTPTIAIHDTGAADDGVTYDSSVVVGNLDPDGAFQYSEDGGQTWSQTYGVADDGNGYISLTQGAHALEVRAVNAAGTYSTLATAQVTVDTHIPASGLTLGHIGDGAEGDTHTSLDEADVVFNYTGAIAEGDTITYSTDGQTYLPVSNGMIDFEHKTITLADLQLNPDVTVTFHAASQAGLSNTLQVDIDGPHTAFTVDLSQLDHGLTVDVQQDAHFYLTANGQAPVQVLSNASDGDAIPYEFVTLGAQAVAVQGTLGAGPSADELTNDLNTTYGLGTDHADTLTGADYVWGFGGDDTLSASLSGYSTLVGGLGADQIHSEMISSNLLYTSVQDSFLATGADAAHGFDTVYVSTTGTHTSENFTFEGASLTNFSELNVQGTYTGTETGDALYSLLTESIGTSLNGSSAAVLINMGTDVDSKGIHFLVVDQNHSHTVDNGDFVIEIVGAINPQSYSYGGTGITLGTGA